MYCAVERAHKFCWCFIWPTSKTLANLKNATSSGNAAFSPKCVNEWRTIIQVLPHNFTVNSKPNFLIVYLFNSKHETDQISNKQWIVIFHGNSFCNNTGSGHAIASKFTQATEQHVQDNRFEYTFIMLSMNFEYDDIPIEVDSKI